MPTGSTSSANRRRLGTGVVPSPLRSTPNVARRSTSAAPLASLIASSAFTASSGFRSATCAATPACTLIIARLCATTSCTSRAILNRSCSECHRRRSTADLRARLNTANAGAATNGPTCPAT